MKSYKVKATRLMLGTIGLFSFGATAQAQFTLEGEIRPRFEYRNGYKSVADSNQSNAAFVQQRTRLNFGYKTEGYIFKVTLQDVRVWGSQPQLISTAAQQNNSGAYLGVHEAWGKALISKNWALKFGRQEIALDDHRIFGSVGWAQQARSHDAAILKFNKKKFKADFGVAYNQDRAALTGTEASKGSYKAFQYLWLHNDFGKNFGASVLFLNNGKEQLDSTRYSNQPTQAYYKDNYSQTIGTKLTYKKDKLKVNGAFYTQIGHDGSRVTYFSDYDGKYNKEISALNYSLDVSYQITKKFSAGIGYEYLSGNSQTDTSASYKRTNHAFTPFYGTNHKFNGHMDYFYVGNHSGSVGLQDLYVNAKYKADKFWVAGAVHMFSAAENVLDGFKIGQDNAAAIAAGTPVTDVDQYQVMDAAFGTEIDLSVGFNLSKGVAFKAGYSVMMATETLAYLKGTTDYQGQGYADELSSWGWAMIVVKPNFTENKDKK